MLVLGGRLLNSKPYRSRCTPLPKGTGTFFLLPQSPRLPTDSLHGKGPLAEPLTPHNCWATRADGRVLQRCVLIPNDPAAEKYAEDCVGKYEYMPDESWKGSGTCTDKYKDGTKTEAWEEGSLLKEYPYKITGGTGKYQGASGGGTYVYENLTDSLAGGTYKGRLILP